MPKVRGIERFAEAMRNCKGGYVLIGEVPAASYLISKAILLGLQRIWMLS